MNIFNRGPKIATGNNKPIFIVGSGPSLKKINLKKLKNFDTMAFNRSYIAFGDWGFQPTYFGGIDFVVNQDNKDSYVELIKKSRIKHFFFPFNWTSYKYFRSPRTTLVKITSDPRNVDLNFNNLKVGNSGLFGLQVAVGLLGYKTIFLLGCDANYQEKVKDTVYRELKYESNGNSDINHFRTDYYGKGTVYNKPQAGVYHYPAWKSFYCKYLERNRDINVYNCSEESKLKFFKYISFDDAIKIAVRSNKQNVKKL